MRPIYLDHNATTPLDPRVLAAMLPWLTDEFGNPASAHHDYGWRAADAVEHARYQVAALLGARPAEIIFTSGATEANNLAILCAGGSGALCSSIEHASVLGPCRRVGCITLPVDALGRVDPVAVGRAVTPGSIVSIHLANNEIGTLEPLAAIVRAVGRRAVVHTDATQAPRMDVRTLGVDLVSISAHKMYGPKGAGALYVRTGMRLLPAFAGGGQERGLRPGTLNVAAIVGFGHAAEIERTEGPTHEHVVGRLRDRLWTRLSAAGARFVGPPPLGAGRLTGNLSVRFAGVRAADLLAECPEVAASAGAACASSRTWRPSHVLTAIGLSPEQAREVVRFGVGRGTTTEQIDEAGEAIVAAVERLHR